MCVFFKLCVIFALIQCTPPQWVMINTQRSKTLVLQNTQQLQPRFPPKQKLQFHWKAKSLKPSSDAVHLSKLTILIFSAGYSEDFSPMWHFSKNSSQFLWTAFPEIEKRSQFCVVLHVVNMCWSFVFDFQVSSGSFIFCYTLCLSVFGLRRSLVHRLLLHFFVLCGLSYFRH